MHLPEQGRRLTAGSPEPDALSLLIYTSSRSLTHSHHNSGQENPRARNVAQQLAHQASSRREADETRASEELRVG